MIRTLLAGTGVVLACSASVHAQVDYSQAPDPMTLSVDTAPIVRAETLNFTGPDAHDVALLINGKLQLLASPARFGSGYSFPAPVLDFCPARQDAAHDDLVLVTETGLELAKYSAGEVATIAIDASGDWLQTRHIVAASNGGQTQLFALAADGLAVLRATLENAALLNEKAFPLGAECTHLVALDFYPQQAGVEFAVGGASGLWVYNANGGASQQWPTFQGLLELVRNPGNPPASDTLLYRARWATEESPPTEPREILLELSPAGLSWPLLSGAHSLAGCASASLEGNAVGTTGADLVVAWADVPEILFLHGTQTPTQYPLQLAPVGQPWRAALDGPAYDPPLIAPRICAADFNADSYCDMLLLDSAHGRGFVLTGRPADVDDPSPRVDGPDVLPPVDPGDPPPGVDTFTKTLAFSAHMSVPRGWTQPPNRLHIAIWQRHYTEPETASTVDNPAWHCNTVTVDFASNAHIDVPYNVTGTTDYPLEETIFYVQVTPLRDDGGTVLIGPSSTWVQCDDVYRICDLLDNEQDPFWKPCSEVIANSPRHIDDAGPVTISGFNRRSRVGPFPPNTLPTGCPL